MNVSEEHAMVRQLLQKLGSSYVYTEPTIAGPFDHQPVKLVITARPSRPEAPRAPTVASTPSASEGPSALAFALLGETPGTAPLPRRAPDPAPAPAPPPPPATPDPAKVLVESLELRGHRVLTRDGKLFVSESSKLNDEDRAAIKSMKPQLIALADPWVDPQETTLSVFLGGISSTSVNTEWKVDELPEFLPDEIVLNFATDGLDWTRGARPVGLTVSSMDGQLTRFLPFRFAGGNLDEEVVKRWVREMVRNKKITNSKTKFDIHMSRMWGIDLEEQGCTFSDIQQTAALIDDRRKRFAIDVLAKDYLPGEDFAGRIWTGEAQHASHHASEVAEREYVTARLVGRLVEKMYPILDAENLREVQSLEDDVIPTVVEMEKNGSPLDLELLDQMHTEVHARHKELLMEISNDVGFAFEHTAKGWQRLLEHLHLPIPTSFDEKTLSQYEHPLVRKGSFASQHMQLASKTFDAYKANVQDGILHFDINQLKGDEGGTVSGRFSIGYVQQVPNHDNHHAAFGDGVLDDCVQSECHWFPRRLFIPGTGEALEADAMQIEFRLLVHFSKNPALLQAYRDDPRMSFHKKMQKMLEQYKPDMLYSHTKNYNFASQYGARSIKLATMMGFITEKEGEEIRRNKRWNDPRLDLIHGIEAAYKQAHPEAGELLEEATHLAMPRCDDRCRQSDRLHQRLQHRGFVKTLLGRRSRFLDSYKAYIGLNRVLQGTGADIMKKKLVEVHKARKDTGFLLRLTNHDAVLGDATTPETRGKIDRLLNEQTFSQLRVPILWSVGIGKSWAGAK